MTSAGKASLLPSSTMSNNNNNPGSIMASAVDAEMQKLRSMKQELDQLRHDLSIVLSQETENEMVLVELDLIAEQQQQQQEQASSSSSVSLYKLLGPVLVPQPVEEGQTTVRKRLEFIRSEKERLESKIQGIEKKGEALSIKIQGMQAALQQQTAQAVQSVMAASQYGQS
jgi:prefoldin beta subunit